MAIPSGTNLIISDVLRYKHLKLFSLETSVKLRITELQGSISQHRLQPSFQNFQYENYCKKQFFLTGQITIIEDVHNQ